MTRKLSLILLFTLVATLFLALPQIAAAQPQYQDQDQYQDQSQAQIVDPPTRVARLNYVQGSVSFQPAGEDDWIEADVNRPLTTGDNLWADRNSRGELHIGATSIRLSGDTGISFLNLDDRTVQLQLAQGTIEIHVRHMDPGNAFEIDTPNLAFTLAASGEYRIRTDPDGNSTSIIVREGAGQVTGAGESYDLTPGQQYTFNGTDQLSFYAQGAPDFDQFEDWCQAQDQRENSSASARYVSRDIDGYYDLDDNGVWQNDPEYGAVWVPSRVAVGWAPYRYGHWVWINPWGWTWVEDEPWGFAPFHYGRWAYVRGAYWGWVPGPVVVRPVYAPALVAFVGGGGGGLSVAVGFGGGFAGVAWFPLGPRDVYIPGYRASPRYVQNINVTNTRVVNVTQVTNVYNTYVVNRNVTNVTVNRVNYTYANNAVAVTAVSRETFVGAKPVAAANVRVTTEQLQSAHVVEQTSLAPTRASYVAAAAKPARGKPPVAFNEKPVVARLNPPAPVVSHSIVHSATAAPAARPGQPAPPAARANEAVAPARTNEPVAAPRTNEPAPAARNNNNAPPPQPARVAVPPPQPARVPEPAPAHAVEPAPEPAPARAPAPPPARPAAPAYNNDNLSRTPQYPNTDTRTTVNPNERANTNERPNANANERPNPNVNERPNANERPNPNQRPPAAEPLQQHPAVKYTPPTKAKDEQYDVHPPLNQKAPTPPPAEHKEPPAPEKHPAPPPKTDPSAHPKN